MPPVENPPNPFSPARCEPLVPPRPAGLAVREETACSILTSNDSPDIPYRWSVNPYRGCQHACAYCYARRTHEYLDLGAGTDFETQLVAKTNAPERLAAQLRGSTWRREYIAFSGVTDCYQPIEATYRLTRGCLEECAALANPIGVVTKSDLVVRDADLLVQLHRRGGARVYFSIPFADETVATLIEPGAPPPSRRFAALRALHDAGVPVGLLVAPLIPGLNDRGIPELLARAAECGADDAAYAPVRLPGSVADVFLARLRRDLPLAAERVEARIRDLRGGRLNNAQFGCRMEGHGAYWESVQRLFDVSATRAGIGPGGRCQETVTAPASPRQLALFE